MALPEAQPTLGLSLPFSLCPSEVLVPRESAVHSANASPVGLTDVALRFPPMVLSDHLTVHVGN